DLSRFLVGPEQSVGERHRLHSGNAAEALDVGKRQRRSTEVGGAHEQDVRAGSGDGVLDTRLQALQDAEQGEGDSDLQEDQSGTAGFAPDTGPQEGKVFHAVLSMTAPADSTRMRRRGGRLRDGPPVLPDQASTVRPRAVRGTPSGPAGAHQNGP